jgi:hypothetical protein
MAKSPLPLKKKGEASSTQCWKHTHCCTKNLLKTNKGWWVWGRGGEQNKNNKNNRTKLLLYNQSISTGTQNCQKEHGKRAPHGSHLRRSHAENFARAHNARDRELT